MAGMRGTVIAILGSLGSLGRLGSIAVGGRLAAALRRGGRCGRGSRCGGCLLLSLSRGGRLRTRRLGLSWLSRRRGACRWLRALHRNRGSSSTSSRGRRRCAAGADHDRLGVAMSRDGHEHARGRDKGDQHERAHDGGEAGPEADLLEPGIDSSAQAAVGRRGLVSPNVHNRGRYR